MRFPARAPRSQKKLSVLFVKYYPKCTSNPDNLSIIDSLQNIVETKIRKTKEKEDVTQNSYKKHGESLDFVKAVVSEYESALYVLFDTEGKIIEYILPKKAQPTTLLLVQLSKGVFGTPKKPIQYIHKGMSSVEKFGVDEFNDYIPEKKDCDDIELHLKVMRVLLKLRKEQKSKSYGDKSKITIEEVKKHAENAKGYCKCDVQTLEDDSRLYTTIIISKSSIKNDGVCKECKLTKIILLEI